MSLVFEFISLEGKPSPLHTLQGQLFLVGCLWTGIAGLTAENVRIRSSLRNGMRTATPASIESDAMNPPTSSLTDI